MQNFSNFVDCWVVVELITGCCFYGYVMGIGEDFLWITVDACIDGHSFSDLIDVSFDDIVSIKEKKD